MSENVYCTWSDNPDQWFPINHSCDPNTWLEGLTVVARKPISAGEEVIILKRY